MRSTEAREPIRLWALVTSSARLTLKNQLSHPISLCFEQLSYLVQLAISLLLWRHLFTRLPRLEGWTFDGVLLLNLFGGLFIAVFHSVFQGCHSFHNIIRSGGIDGYLCRPVDPRLAHMAMQMQPHELLNRLVGLVPLVLFIHYRGGSIDPAKLAAGLAAMTLGLAAFSAIQLTITYLAFWLVRGDAILSFLDLFYGFYKFPLNALPFGAQLGLTVFVPVLLAVTYPAMYSAGIASAGSLVRAALASLALLVVWMVAQERLWRRGLAAYQSPGN